MAITNIDFISESYFRDKVPFNLNVDWKDIKPHININQDIYIQDELGSNFYDELLTKYDNQSLSIDETELVFHIKPVVAFRTALSSISFISYNVKNKGVQTQYGDNSDSVERGTIIYLKNQLENWSEYYTKRLQNYLCDNGNLFPGYITNNSDDVKPNNNSPYDGGFAFY